MNKVEKIKQNYVLLLAEKKSSALYFINKYLISFSVFVLTLNNHPLFEFIKKFKLVTAAVVNGVFIF